MDEQTKSELNIYLEKSKLSTVKSSWIEKNLINLWSFMFNLSGDSFSEKVFRYSNASNLQDSCKTCGKRTQFLSINRGYREYCSKNCSNSDPVAINQKVEQYKKNYIEKYGVDNPMKNEISKNKLIESKSKLDYEKINQKFKETMIAKWGVDNPSKIDEIKEKKKETTIRNFGVENPFQSEDVKNKIKDKLISNIGFDHPLKSCEIKAKMKKHLLLKYNVDNPMKSDEVKEKFKKTCLKKWGHSHFSSSEEIKLLKKQNKISVHNELLKNKGLAVIDILDSSLILNCNKCNSEFEIHTSTFHVRKNNQFDICTICNPIQINRSFLEETLRKFIEENYSGEIIPGAKIDKKEIDIYLPDEKIGFEFNGLYWHGDKFKNKSFHSDKMKFFKERGIKLFFIWEDDWLNNSELIKSMILNKLNLVSERIPARKCEIRQIDDQKLVREFLAENHLQGFVGAKVKLGLFYDQELVSIMTFGELRKNLGKKSEQGKWELLRFCNRKNTVVVGGASKLLNYFKSNFEWDSILSYSKTDYSDGGLYQKLGFKYEGDTVQNYYWVVKGRRVNRFNFRKDKLIRSGANKDLTEKEIMESKGCWRVWDCGNSRWILNK